MLLVVALGMVVLGTVVKRVGARQAEERREAELAPVRKLTFEDITTFGTELQDLDAELAGHPLDEGARADYQRALDAYESAKTAADAMRVPDDVRHVTEIVEDGRYAVACVRARVAGRPLPTRRPPCTCCRRTVAAKGNAAGSRIATASRGRRCRPTWSNGSPIRRPPPSA